MKDLLTKLQWVTILLVLVKSVNAQETLDIETKIKDLNSLQNDSASLDFSTSLVVNFNRTDLINWATGGKPQTTFNIVWLSDAIRKWRQWNLKGNLRISYGFVKPHGEPLSKTDDYLGLSVFGNREISEKVSLTLLGDLKTQISITKDDTGGVLSSLFSPAWIVMATGLTLNGKYVESFLSPITLKATLINEKLPMVQRYGVPKGQSKRYEPGAYVLIKLNLTYRFATVSSRFEAFMAYQQLQIPDINWETLLSFKLTKWLGMGYFVHVIYDTDVAGPDMSATEYLRYLQIKTVLGVSITLSV